MADFWIRKDYLTREDGQDKHITLGTRVRVLRDAADKAVFRRFAPRGAVGVVVQSGNANASAKRSCGTTAAWRVRLDAQQNPIRIKGGAETQKFCARIADAYDRAPGFDADAVGSYAALARSIDKLYKQVQSKVKVVFVAGQPYADDKELVDGVRRTGILYISTDFNEHPYFTPEQNLRFRAVHDWFAHIGPGRTFSQRGEVAAYNAQAKLVPRAALPALFTEVVGQACYATTHGNFPEQKVAVLPGFDYYNVGKGAAMTNPTKRNRKAAGVARRTTSVADWQYRQDANIKDWCEACLTRAPDAGIRRVKGLDDSAWLLCAQCRNDHWRIERGLNVVRNPNSRRHSTVARNPRSEYTNFVVILDPNLEAPIESGWEYLDDARDRARELRADGEHVAVMSRAGLLRKGVDPKLKRYWFTGVWPRRA